MKCQPTARSALLSLSHSNCCCHCQPSLILGVEKIIFVCRIAVLPASDKADTLGKANNLAPIQTKFLNMWIEHLKTSCKFLLLVEQQPAIPQLLHSWIWVCVLPFRCSHPLNIYSNSFPCLQQPGPWCFSLLWSHETHNPFLLWIN